MDFIYPDLEYKNSKLNLPDIFILKGHPYMETNIDITGSTGLTMNGQLSDLINNPVEFVWARDSDPLTDRFSITFENTGSLINPYYMVTIRCKDDYTNTYDNHQNFSGTGFTISKEFFETNVNRFIEHPYIQIVQTVNSLSIFLFKIKDGDLNTNLYYFYHVGYTVPNTQFNYYDSPIVNTCYLINTETRKTNGKVTFEQKYVRNFSNLVSKDAYESAYPTICSLGEQPTNGWLTEFVIHDDSESLGYPYIGWANDMLASSGISNYDVGVPVYDSTLNEWYMPVFNFSNKIVMYKTNVQT